MLCVPTIHFREQRNKWNSGTVELLTNKDLSIHTRHKGKIWRNQLKSLSDLVIRVLFVILLSVALATDQFYWSWIWLTPIVLASILNTILAIKTPMHRTIDVIFAALLIAPEIYLWVNLMTFSQVWLQKLSSNKKDGWANQYAAETGKTRSKLAQGMLLVTITILIIGYVCYYYRDFLTSEALQQSINPYLMGGWITLTYLTIIKSLMMAYQIWTLRGSHSA